MKDTVAWLKVIGLGLVKLPLKVIAPVAVLFLDDYKRSTHPIFGVRDTKDFSWYNIGVRNGCHNLFTVDMPVFTTESNTEDTTLELLSGRQWRYRRSVDGKYVSFRISWGEPRQKGKKEFYVGWTLNDQPYARLTFFQLRPF